MNESELHIPPMTTTSGARASVFECWGKHLPPTQCVDRDAAILKEIAGKSVLHLGATDSPFTQDAARQGRLLHLKVIRAASFAVGLDRDEKQLEWLRTQYGLDHLVVGDACQLESCLPHHKFDVVLCADIIEHVDSPAAMLRGVHEALNSSGTLIVSTINALGAKLVLRGLSGREAVHPDHIAYYSYGTLGSLLLRCGFDVTSIRTFAYGTVSPVSKVLFKALFHGFPHLADGILITARPRAIGCDGIPRRTENCTTFE